MFKYYISNTPFGGAVSYDIPWEDFPDYPWEEGYVFNRQINRSKTGKVSSHELWKKKKWNLHFKAVSPACAASFLAIADANLPFFVGWTFDTETATATCVFLEKNFIPKETMRGLFNFNFKFEEWNE